MRTQTEAGIQTVLYFRPSMQLGACEESEHSTFASSNRRVESQ